MWWGEPHMVGGAAGGEPLVRGEPQNFFGIFFPLGVGEGAGGNHNMWCIRTHEGGCLGRKVEKSGKFSLDVGRSVIYFLSRSS